MIQIGRRRIYIILRGAYSGVGINKTIINKRNFHIKYPTFGGPRLGNISRVVISLAMLVNDFPADGPDGRNPGDRLRCV